MLYYIMWQGQRERGKFALCLFWNHYMKTGTNDLGFNSWQRQEIYFFSKMSRRVVWPTHLPIQWVLVVLSWVKQRGSKVAHSSIPSGAYITHEGIYTSVPPVWLHNINTDFMAFTNVGDWSVSPQVGNFGTRWRTVVNFTTYAWVKKTLIPEDRRATLVTEKRKFLAPACNHDLKSSAVQTRL